LKYCRKSHFLKFFLKWIPGANESKVDRILPIDLMKSSSLSWWISSRPKVATEWRLQAYSQISRVGIGSKGGIIAEDHGRWLISSLDIIAESAAAAAAATIAAAAAALKSVRIERKKEGDRIGSSEIDDDLHRRIIGVSGAIYPCRLISRINDKRMIEDGTLPSDILESKWQEFLSYSARSHPRSGQSKPLSIVFIIIIINITIIIIIVIVIINMYT